MSLSLFTRMPSVSVSGQGNNVPNAASSVKSIGDVRSKRYVRYTVGFTPFSFAVSTTHT